MTSVGVISSAAARINRLINYPGQPAMPSDDADVFLEHLKKIKELVVTAYQRKEEKSVELEIKEVVRLSYEIVDVIADSFKSGTVPKNLKDLLEKLKGGQDQLTMKIHPEIKITDSPESSAGSSRPKKLGQRENNGTAFVRDVGNYFSSMLNPKSPTTTVSRAQKPEGTNKAESTTAAISGQNQKQEGARKAESTAAAVSGQNQKQEGARKAESTAAQNQKQEATNKAESMTAAVSGQQEGTNKAESTATAISVQNQKQEGTNKAESTATAISVQNQKQKQEGTIIAITSEIQEEQEPLFERLKKDLTKKELLKDQHREVYIIGESGMGKSTITRKLYNDPDIREPFDVCGWVNVGRNFAIKGVLQLLLQQLRGGEQHPDVRKMNEAALIVDIFFAVDGKSYLLVLENVGSPSDWESISIALPLENSTRIIITTSSTEFSSSPHHYKVTGLTLDETLALLNEEATTFGLEIRDAIYKISGGSPLYTTILGKSLESEADDPRLIDELGSYEHISRTPQVIDVSYRRLALDLKPCFLYLGLFPPGQHIQVDKLYLLLLAENLTPSPERISFRENLDKLAALKLVKVEESGTRGGLYDSCRLHSKVQEFCRSKGSDEEFLQIVDFEGFKPDVGPHTRRLAIDMRNYGGDSSISFTGEASAKKILSLLVFDAASEGKTGWPSGVDDLAEFVHLRVLNFGEVDFKLRKLPKGLEKLNLLRFLSFRGCFLEELPSSLSSLKQVEALDLLVRDDCCVVIPDNIFVNMNRMVHLYLPRAYRINGKKKLKLQGMQMLETLVNFDTEVFDVGDLSQLEKLKILTTISNGENPENTEAVIDLLNERKEKLQHSSVEVRSFDCYNGASTSALKKLMQCRFVHSLRIEGEIGELPEEEDEAEGGERSVAEMVLHGSELEDDPMGYFGKFENLLSLVLEDDAFMGTEILISPSPLFGKLRSLKLRNLQYLEKLTIEEGALRKLTSLQIENCGDELDLTIPKELYDRLKNEIGGDAYSVVPAPPKFKTTP